MLEGTTKEMRVIADTVDDFIKKYYDHMEAEENIFFRRQISGCPTINGRT
ncbi:hypothetical protein C4K04_3462 [Pseudomonas chlororaphis]|uniref:Hemerythrin-like domain-containing protein n=1 Tax=Pseudomonas chlororaphis TaxID=587753 RepID=A0A3G7TPT8_9PSED|nr:hypothetical protein C4K04_3462 [Pseudomonas chlororaphis]